MALKKKTHLLPRHAAKKNKKHLWYYLVSRFLWMDLAWANQSQQILGGCPRILIKVELTNSHNIINYVNFKIIKISVLVDLATSHFW